MWLVYVFVVACFHRCDSVHSFYLLKVRLLGRWEHLSPRLLPWVWSHTHKVTRGTERTVFCKLSSDLHMCALACASMHARASTLSHTHIHTCIKINILWKNFKAVVLCQQQSDVSPGSVSFLLYLLLHHFFPVPDLTYCSFVPKPQHGNTCTCILYTSI